MPHATSAVRTARLHKPLIRVLIVDDSAVARAALSRIVSETPSFEVAAALDSGRRAIEWLKTIEVDIILLDIQMPGFDGLAALPELLAVAGGARVLIVSTLAADGTRAAVEALALGASDTLAKPAAGALGRDFGIRLAEKMLGLGTARIFDAVARPVEAYSTRTATDEPIACLALGASTGGLHALAAFFSGLPAAFDAPVLITQHLPPVFMPFFAEQLSRLASRPVQVAGDHQMLERGQILVAPGTMHLGCRRTGGAVRTMLLSHQAASRCCPSIDPMFAGVADAFGPDAAGVVLTGMGRDGEIGAAALVKAGATVVVQDAQSSAIWGMPGVVARAGLASMIAPPAELARYIGHRGSAS